MWCWTYLSWTFWVYKHFRICHFRSKAKSVSHFLGFSCALQWWTQKASQPCCSSSAFLMLYWPQHPVFCFKKKFFYTFCMLLTMLLSVTCVSFWQKQTVSSCSYMPVICTTCWRITTASANTGAIAPLSSRSYSVYWMQKKQNCFWNWPDSSWRSVLNCHLLALTFVLSSFLSLLWLLIYLVCCGLVL